MNLPTSSPPGLADELRFVRQAVEARDARRDVSLPLAVLWALITTAGFALIDLRPAWAGWYWLAAGPLGMAASAWLGRRAAFDSGLLRRGEGLRHFLHWSTILTAWAAIVAIAAAHDLPGALVGQMTVLVVGVVWFLGGVHLDRRFLAPGVVLIVGAAALPFLPFLPWTLLGVATSAALLFAAWKANTRCAKVSTEP